MRYFNPLYIDSRVNILNDILTPYTLIPGSIYCTISWLQCYYIATIFWPPSHYFEPPPISTQSFVGYVQLLNMAYFYSYIIFMNFKWLGWRGGGSQARLHSDWCCVPSTANTTIYNLMKSPLPHLLQTSLDSYRYYSQWWCTKYICNTQKLSNCCIITTNKRPVSLYSFPTHSNRDKEHMGVKT